MREYRAERTNNRLMCDQREVLGHFRHGDVTQQQCACTNITLKQLVYVIMDFVILQHILNTFSKFCLKDIEILVPQTFSIGCSVCFGSLEPELRA